MQKGDLVEVYPCQFDKFRHFSGTIVDVSLSNARVSVKNRSTNQVVDVNMDQVELMEVDD
jgi:hypothetical protein